MPLVFWRNLGPNLGKIENSEIPSSEPWRFGGKLRFLRLNIEYFWKLRDSRISKLGISWRFLGLNLEHLQNFEISGSKPSRCWNELRCFVKTLTILIWFDVLRPNPSLVFNLFEIPKSKLLRFWILLIPKSKPLRFWIVFKISERNLQYCERCTVSNVTTLQVLKHFRFQDRNLQYMFKSRMNLAGITCC